MCRNLLKAGLALTVWNRSPEKIKRLAKRGAKVADSPLDAVAGANVVITMLSDGPAVTDLICQHKACLVAPLYSRVIPRLQSNHL